MMEKKKVDHKDLFIALVSAYITDFKEELELNDLLYNKGIDIANYQSPASLALCNLIELCFGEDIVDFVFDFANEGKIDFYWKINGKTEKYYTATSVEELYDFLYG